MDRVGQVSGRNIQVSCWVVSFGRQHVENVVMWVGWARLWNISKEKEGFSCFITSFITSLIFCWIKSYVTVSGGRKGYCLSVQSAFSTHQQHLDKYHLMQMLYRFFNLNFIKCKERLLPWGWISKSSKEKSQNTACSVILMSPVIIYTTLIQWLRPTEQSQLLYWYASKHPTLKVASSRKLLLSECIITEM